VIAIHEHLAATPAISIAERSIDIPCGRDLESLHASSERLLVLRLGQHVNMRTLDADVNDPDPLAHRRRDGRVTNCAVQLGSTKATDLGQHAQHDVQHVPRLDLRPPLVSGPRTRTRRLASGTSALAAPPEQLLLYVPLARRFRPVRRHIFCIATPHVGVN
jgi:hypothetical protein